MGIIQESVSKTTKKEGKKVEVGVGQVREVYKIINEQTGGLFYKLLKKINTLNVEDLKQMDIILNVKK